MGTHWKPLNTFKRFENTNQGQQGRLGGRVVTGKGLRAAGTEGFGHILE